MKTIGLIGGMSWESSLEYYRIINETVKSTLGGFHSARCVMYSVDFAEIEALQHQGEWDRAAEKMIEAAHHVENGGADFLLICANTMHRMADDVQRHISIPLLHIADVTAEAIRSQGLTSVGLLGTRYTMEEPFYKDRLVEKHNLKVLVPSAAERDIIHNVIYFELCDGQIKQSSKKSYIRIMEALVDRGAEGIILGCTEIGLFISQEDSKVPVFDTTRIHAVAAVDYALLNR